MSEEEQNGSEVETQTKDIANKDPFAGAAGYAVPRKINITYTVVFDSEEDAKLYYHYIRLLKKKHPEVRTIGGRILTEVKAAIPELEKVYGKAKKKTGKQYPLGHEPQDEVAIESPQAK